MKLLYPLHITLFVALAVSASAASIVDGIRTFDTSCERIDSNMVISATIQLDGLDLGRNEQVIITPVLNGDDDRRLELPSVLVNGRNMQYIYERKGVSRNIAARYTSLKTVLRRTNGKPQQLRYVEETPAERWMMYPGTQLSFVIDTCGCGIEKGFAITEPVEVSTDLAQVMSTAFITPRVTELPVSIHEGKAKVQFEVDRTELHDTPYRTRRGQLIDNVAQLKMIDDTVQYALTDPNVEIAAIDICGYASPESPYLHNDELATGRSRALAEYLAAKYNLPAENCHYSAVPENWEGFRRFVVASDLITDNQRRELLELIDAPVYGPADYDAKEKTLKTDRRFRDLYSKLILPVWFPELRVTHFAITTRLRPLSDEKLAEVILTTPELLSLNQMFRVARLYPEGSEEFNRTIATALKYYPESEEANLNGAVAALNDGDNELAERLLARAGTSPEAENARGVLATRQRRYDDAIGHFKAAGALPEAVMNRNYLQW